MVRRLELLAPARNKDIGIAAIDCGADAVYIAGPAFGARQAAGNSMEDIRELCGYAHRFGVKIFLTLNTILYDDELEEAYRLMCAAQNAGVDALIVQDLSLLKLADGGPDGTGRKIRIPLHASTQCAIRSADKAAFYKSLGFSRLVLEREMSLQEIRRISGAVGGELEFFVHGALCVCYSGQCYLSENIAGKSANRGECIQACRSLYDLVDGSGRVIVRNKALLSLKDYNLLHRLSDLADAGITSFKIEGRLKNISYVRNIVRAYSEALDALVSECPERYRRASFGKVSGGFTPDPDKTFNRGYTELFIDGRRGKWSSMNTPKGMGEAIGTVATVRHISSDEMEISVALDKGVVLSNGDGFAFTSKDSEIIGFRGDLCSGNTIRCRKVHALHAGVTLYRNISTAFEKSITSHPCTRMMTALCTVEITGGSICGGTSGHKSGVSDTAREDYGRGNRSGDCGSGYIIYASACSEDGRCVSISADAGCVRAENPERMFSMIRTQIGKSSGQYLFSLKDGADGISVRTEDGSIPFVGAAFLNALRRSLAEELDKPEDLHAGSFPTGDRHIENSQTECHNAGAADDFLPKVLDYRFNVSNSLARQVYMEHGACEIQPAYELCKPSGAELMRTKYCICHELGMCPRYHPGRNGISQKGDSQKSVQKTPSTLSLKNNGRTLALGFDCAKCEMTVTEKLP